MNQKELFANPPFGFLGTDLFMLNADLKPEEVRRQIREMKKQGFESFIARTYMGLDVEYPGEEFYAVMEAAAKEAEACGMTIYLQAGYMPAAIPDLPEEYCQQRLVYENGIVSVKRREMAIDMLSTRAVAYYVKRTYGDFWNRFRERFGNVFPSIWVDEPDFWQDLPWTDTFDDTFESMWGYRLLPVAETLFTEAEESERNRYRYRRTVTAMLQNGYFKGVRDWCAENHLAFSGHLMHEDSFSGQIIHTADCMPMYQYFDVPGIDMLTGNLEWPIYKQDYRFLLTPLQCASAAHQTGKNQILAEMFGVSTENLTMQMQKNLLSYLYSLGINYRCNHALFYSLRGARKRRYVPAFNDYQPYFSEYRRFNDYARRTSWAMREGKPDKNVLLLTPIETLYAKQIDPRDRSSKWDNQFVRVLRNFTGKQIAFDLGDEEMISQMGAVENQTFRVGEMQYSTVVLPNMEYLRSSTKELLKQFAANGGMVLVIGEAPTKQDGFDAVFDVPAIFCKTSAQAAALLHRAEPFRLSGDAADVQMNRRVTENGYIILLHNVRKETYRGMLQTERCWKAQKLDAVTGEISDFPAENANAFPIIIEGEDTLLLSMESGVPAIPETESAATVLELKPDWILTRNASNTFLLDFCRYRTEGGAWSEDLPVMAVFQILNAKKYCGTVEIESQFFVETGAKVEKLVIERPGEKRIWINETEISNRPDGFFCARDFHTLPIAELIREGENTVRYSCVFKPEKEQEHFLFTLFKRLGDAEVENMMVLGDFEVRTEQESTNINCLRFDRFMTLKAPENKTDGLVTASGYPFYAGSAWLKQNVWVENPGKKATLRIGTMDACAVRVKINGTEAGVIWSKPTELCTDDLWNRGENTVELEVIGTLRNLIGPFHRPIGEQHETWGSYGSFDFPWSGLKNLKTGEMDWDWYQHRVPDNDNWIESYLLVPFGVKDVTIAFHD